MELNVSPSGDAYYFPPRDLDIFRQIAFTGGLVLQFAGNSAQTTVDEQWHGAG